MEVFNLVSLSRFYLFYSYANCYFSGSNYVANCENEAIEIADRNHRLESNPNSTVHTTARGIRNQTPRNQEVVNTHGFEKINIHHAEDQEVIDHVFGYLFSLSSNGATSGNLNEVFDFTITSMVGPDYERGPRGGSFLGKDYDGTILVRGKNYSVKMYLGFTNEKVRDPYWTGVNLLNIISREQELGTTSSGVVGLNYQLLIGAPYPRNEYVPVRFIFDNQVVRDLIESVFK